MIQAALGEEMSFEGLDRSITISLPEGTQPGDIVKVYGEGITALNDKGPRGDLYLRVKVSVPTDLNSAQRAHLEAFKALS